MSRGAPDFSVDGRLREQQCAYALWFPLDMGDARAVPEGGDPFMVLSFAQHLLGHSLCEGRFEDLPPGERRRVHREARRAIERERPQAFLQAGVCCRRWKATAGCASTCRPSTRTPTVAT